MTSAPAAPQCCATPVCKNIFLLQALLLCTLIYAMNKTRFCTNRALTFISRFASFQIIKFKHITSKFLTKNNILNMLKQYAQAMHLWYKYEKTSKPLSAAWTFFTLVEAPPQSPANTNCVLITQSFRLRLRDSANRFLFTNLTLKHSVIHARIDAKVRRFT